MIDWTNLEHVALAAAIIYAGFAKAKGSALEVAAAELSIWKDKVSRLESDLKDSNGRNAANESSIAELRGQVKIYTEVIGGEGVLKNLSDQLQGIRNSQLEHNVVLGALVKTLEAIERNTKPQRETTARSRKTDKP